MGPDEVISCPACRHLLRVPPDWLGTQVQCPECQAMFRAPSRDAEGRLTAAELLAPSAASAQPAAGWRTDWLLLAPAFGLMLLGVIGSIANGWQFVRFCLNPGAAQATVKETMELMRAKAGNPEEEKQLQDQAASSASLAIGVTGFCTGLSLLEFLGGLSIVCRWRYRLAPIGCAAAALNVSGLCCIPGTVFGLWAAILLWSPEGRAHFRR